MFGLGDLPAPLGITSAATLTSPLPTLLSSSQSHSWNRVALSPSTPTPKPPRSSTYTTTTRRILTITMSTNGVPLRPATSSSSCLLPRDHLPTLPLHLVEEATPNHGLLLKPPQPNLQQRSNAGRIIDCHSRNAGWQRIARGQR